VLLGLRAAPKERAEVSAAEVVYGKQLCLPQQFSACEEADVASDTGDSVAAAAGTGTSRFNWQNGFRGAASQEADGPSFRWSL
jgi:hypothetical protein